MTLSQSFFSPPEFSQGVHHENTRNCSVEKRERSPVAECRAKGVKASPGTQQQLDVVVSSMSASRLSGDIEDATGSSHLKTTGPNNSDDSRKPKPATPHQLPTIETPKRVQQSSSNCQSSASGYHPPLPPKPAGAQLNGRVGRDTVHYGML